MHTQIEIQHWLKINSDKVSLQKRWIYLRLPDNWNLESATMASHVQFPTQRGKENALWEKQKLEGLEWTEFIVFHGWVFERKEDYFSSYWILLSLQSSNSIYFCLVFIFLPLIKMGGERAQIGKIWRSHSSNNECVFSSISSWSFSIEEKVLFESIDKRKVKSYLGDINIWGKTRIFYKNNQKFIIIVMNRCIRFFCASLNFVLINRLKKALGITQWIHLVIKPDHIIS